jgi:hypothetical protein
MDAAAGADRDGLDARRCPRAGSSGSARSSAYPPPVAASWRAGNSWRGSRLRLGRTPGRARPRWQSPDSPSAWLLPTPRPSGTGPTVRVANSSQPASVPSHGSRRARECCAMRCRLRQSQRSPGPASRLAVNFQGAWLEEQQVAAIFQGGRVGVERLPIPTLAHIATRGPK